MLFNTFIEKVFQWDDSKINLFPHAIPQSVIATLKVCHVVIVHSSLLCRSEIKGHIFLFYARRTVVTPVCSIRFYERRASSLCESFVSNL